MVYARWYMHALAIRRLSSLRESASTSASTSLGAAGAAGGAPPPPYEASGAMVISSRPLCARAALGSRGMGAPPWSRLGFAPPPSALSEIWSEMWSELWSEIWSEIWLVNSSRGDLISSSPLAPLAMHTSAIGGGVSSGVQPRTWAEAPPPPLGGVDGGAPPGSLVRRSLVRRSCVKCVLQ